MVEWIEVPLGEIVETFDGPHATPKKTSAGPVFLGISNLNSGRLELVEVDHLSEGDFQRWTKRVTPTAGDLVFSYETRLGQAALIPNGLRCCLGRRMGLLRAKPEVVDQRFLLYAYLGEAFQKTLRSRTVPGSTVDRIPLIEMASFPICIPRSLVEQRRIASVLGALDDKIELNRKVSETLEAMARALSSNWFSTLGKDRVVAGELIHERVLEIGDGYRAKNSELGESGIPFVRAGGLQAGFDLEGAEKLSAESAAKAGNKLSRSGDVAFTSKGTIGRFARVGGDLQPFVYSPQICYWRSLDNRRLHSAVLYAWMLTSDFVDQLMAIAGQTDMAPYASLQDQRRLTLPVFPDSQGEVGARLEILLTRISGARLESLILTSIRDALLPVLVGSGISVRTGGRWPEGVGASVSLS